MTYSIGVCLETSHSRPRWENTVFLQLHSKSIKLEEVYFIIIPFSFGIRLCPFCLLVSYNTIRASPHLYNFIYTLSEYPLQYPQDISNSETATMI